MFSFWISFFFCLFNSQDVEMHLEKIICSVAHQGLPPDRTATSHHSLLTQLLVHKRRAVFRVTPRVLKAGQTARRPRPRTSRRLNPVLAPNPQSERFTNLTQLADPEDPSSLSVTEGIGFPAWEIFNIRYDLRF